MSKHLTSKHIKLHRYTNSGYDPEYISHLLEKGISHKLAQVLKSAGEFQTFISYNEGVIFGSLLHNLAEANRKYILASLQLLIHTYLAHITLTLAQEGDKPVAIRLGNQTGSIPRKRYNPDAWFDAYDYGLIARSPQLLTYLKNLDYEPHLQLKADAYGEVLRYYYRFLKSLGEDSRQSLSLLTKTMKALETIEAGGGFFMELYMPLWIPLLLKDAKLFNQELERSLKTHQKYWKGGDEQTYNDWYGHRNIPLTAIMSYAYDAGIPIEVTSDYTPQALVEGKYQVDVDTKLNFYFEPKEIPWEESLAELRERLKKYDS